MKIQMLVEIDVDATAIEAELFMDDVLQRIRRAVNTRDWPAPNLHAQLTFPDRPYPAPPE
jgi:hypothetical protein